LKPPRPPPAPGPASLHLRDTGRNRLTGIAILSAAVLCFSVLDSSAKWLVATVPLVLVVWMRFVGHVLFTVLVMGPRLRLDLVRTRRPWLQLVRALLLWLMTATNFWALQHLQLAETVSIMFLAPILVAALGAPLLGERIDAGRWVAICVGFIGVLVIVQPGTSGFHPAMLASLAQTVMFAGFILLTRRLAAHDRPEATQFLSALGAAVLISPLLAWSWQMPTTALEWAVVGLTGLAGGLGHYLFALAHRFAPASTLAPFQYQQILYMGALGFLVFGDLPRAGVVIGAAIVVASGIYLLWRERSV
jgi:drug/metabolite transporter (DMT)-like permease